MLQATQVASGSLIIDGTRIDVIERGVGRPVLFLHAENSIERYLRSPENHARGLHRPGCRVYQRRCATTR